MAIVPKKKISIYKKHRRHSTRQTLELKRLSKEYQPSSCQKCGATKLNHRVCTKCGYYGEKQILTIKAKSSKKVIDA